MLMFLHVIWKSYIFAVKLTSNIVNMANTYIRIISLLILSFGFYSWAQAQTCKVNCGVNHEGCLKYKEVYEYDYVTEKPSFPGGETKFVRYINKTREYPKEAYEKGIEGRVICSFVVNSDGSISNIQILRGVEKSLNNEAVRIISKMPDWVPGKIDGQNVPVRVIHPIVFRK